MKSGSGLVKRIFNLKSLFCLAIFVCIVIATIFLIINTSTGSRIIVDKVISQVINYDQIQYEQFEGSLVDGVTYANVEIKDIKELPQGSVVRIQRLNCHLSGIDLGSLNIEFENVRFLLPNSDPIVLSGSFKNLNLDVNIFSRGFTINEVLSYLPDFKLLIPIVGEVKEVDMYISGHYLHPEVKSSLVLDRFVYKGFVLSEVPINIDAQVKDIKDEPTLYGDVWIEKGRLSTNKVNIDLNKSNLKFNGLWNEPEISLSGKSIVEKTKINISLQGTIAKPKLLLSSEPSYPRQKLMIMLATGKKWQSVEDSVDNGLNSVAITKDFIDYFFFAGKSNQFARKFGISDISLKFDGNTKGIGAKKEISDRLELGYGVEQSSATGEVKNVRQVIEGTLKVSDKVTLGLEREIIQKDVVDSINEQTVESNDKVLLKYKKSF